MAHNRTGNSTGWIVGIAAVVIAVVLFGLFTDWFGLYGTEMAPGTTIPPNAPSN